MPGKLLSCLEDFLDSNLSHLLLLLPVAWLPSQSFRFLACLLYLISLQPDPIFVPEATAARCPAVQDSILWKLVSQGFLASIIIQRLQKYV